MAPEQIDNIIWSEADISSLDQNRCTAELDTSSINAPLDEVSDANSAICRKDGIYRIKTSSVCECSNRYSSVSIAAASAENYENGWCLPPIEVLISTACYSAYINEAFEAIGGQPLSLDVFNKETNIWSSTIYRKQPFCLTLAGKSSEIADYRQDYKDPQTAGVVRPVKVFEINYGKNTPLSR